MANEIRIYDSEKIVRHGKKPLPIKVGQARFDKLRKAYGDRYRLYDEDVSGVEVEISNPKKKEAVEVAVDKSPKIDIELTQEKPTDKRIVKHTNPRTGNELTIDTEKGEIIKTKPKKKSAKKAE